MAANNNNNNNQEVDDRCGKCKYSKVPNLQCEDGCLFRDYFPPGSEHFQRISGNYGGGTSKCLEKQMGNLPDEAIHRRAYFDSLLADADARYENRVTGSSGKIQALRVEKGRLINQLAVSLAEENDLRDDNAVLLHENNWWRNQYPNDNPPPFQG